MNKENLTENAFRHDLGEAHACEHLTWNRRQFMMTGGIVGLGSLLLGGLPVSPLVASPFSVNSAAAGEENILVLIKMFGGNDGLNMVFPHSDSAGRPEYINLRPTISHKYGTDYNDQTLLTGFGPTDFALPGNMLPLMPLWHEGKMAILHNVGYPDQNYSHFVSIDQWSTAADSIYDKRYTSGVVGRYLDQDFPSFDETPPTVPPALRIGYSTDLIFTAPGYKQMELVFNDPNEFYRLAQYGKLYDTDGFGDCPSGVERSYLRALTNNSIRYSQSVTHAFNKSTTKVSYPANTFSRLADQLRIVARLIKGRLGTRVYMVYIDGFDTHAEQRNYHPRLLMDLANSISAFYNDLKADNFTKNVCMMSFSEFGRTIRENGSAGTDHGNMSPMLIIGDGVKGGFHGTPMNLNDPTLIAGDVRVYFENQASIDFRSMYATAFQDWMCIDPELVDYSLGATYSRLSLFKNPCSHEAQGSNVHTILLGHNPNEKNPSLTDIKFSQLHSGEVKLSIKAINGKTLAILLDEYTAKGSYTISLDPTKWKLHPGEYIYQLDSGGKTFMRRFKIF